MEHCKPGSCGKSRVCDRKTKLCKSKGKKVSVHKSKSKSRSRSSSSSSSDLSPRELRRRMMAYRREVQQRNPNVNCVPGSCGRLMVCDRATKRCKGKYAKTKKSPVHSLNHTPPCKPGNCGRFKICDRKTKKCKSG